MKPLFFASLADLTAAQQAKLDPYLLAALRNGFTDYSSGGGTQATISIGFTVDTQQGHSAKEIEDFLTGCFAQPAQGRLTNAHLAPLERTGRAYLTADVTLDQLRRIADAPFVPEIQLCANLAPHRPLPRLVPDRSATSPPAAAFRSNKTKILGLIDHGCPFAHQAFLEGEQTRVFAIWDQDTVPDFPVRAGSTPDGYGYGRQVDAGALNGFIGRAKLGGRIDEALCYRAAEYSAVKSRYTHGSLVLGLLASKWPSPSLFEGARPREAAPDAAVVFVQLPRDVPLAPARGCVERCTLDGVRYILDCAPDGAHVAVVVDYGTEMGPHDGSSWFERALDAMISDADQRRRIELNVIFAAGNSHEMKRHAVVFPGSCVDGSAAALRWSIPRSNDAPVTVELWMRADQADFEFSLAGPGVSGSAITFPANSETIDSWPVGEVPSCVVVSKTFGDQRQILIQVAPTNGLRAVAAPAGVWTLGFKAAKGKAAGPVSVYTCWGGRNPGLPQRIWPGKFISDSKLVAVLGEGSILGSGCGTRTLMAGGYEKWGQLSRAEYSSGGQARGGKRANLVHGADWLAVTEESPSLPGLLSLGTRSGSWVRARGTSFAPPQVARKIVDSGGNGLEYRTRPGGPPRGTVMNSTPRPEYGEPRLK